MALCTRVSNARQTEINVPKFRECMYRLYSTSSVTFEGGEIVCERIRDQLNFNALA